MHHPHRPVWTVVVFTTDGRVTNGIKPRRPGASNRIIARSTPVSSQGLVAVVDIRDCYDACCRDSWRGNCNGPVMQHATFVQDFVLHGENLPFLSSSTCIFYASVAAAASSVPSQLNVEFIVHSGTYGYLPLLDRREQCELNFARGYIRSICCSNWLEFKIHCTFVRNNTA